MNGLWNLFRIASISKHRTMTNSEILQADMLDILFEKRNKSYGAYALRKNYDARLLTALGAGLALASVFALFGLQKQDAKEIVVANKNEGIVVREYTIPQKKIEQPPQPPKVNKPKPEQAVKTAKVKFTSQIDIKKDELVKQPVASADDLATKKPGDETSSGKPDDATVTLTGKTDTVNGTGQAPPQLPDYFTAKETAPEFPGGPEALNKFLAKNLSTPDELETGEKKMVKVRFKVAADGFVTGFEIMESGGREFDNEVLRVCKKMPRWKPAFQNGINVPVTYMIPVTFIGSE